MVDGKNTVPGDDDIEATVLFQESAKPARLIQTEPSGKKREHQLVKMTTLLGTSTICDVILDDPASSDQHAKIMISGSTYILNDLDSQNGTRVNGHFINHHVLREGDRIQIGRTFLQFAFMTKAERIAIVDEDTATTSEATTVMAGYTVSETQKPRARWSKKVEVVKKNKGLRRFFSSPVRALISAVGMAFLLLIILISVAQKNRAPQQATTTSLEQATPMLLRENKPTPSAGGAGTDLTERMEQQRLEKVILQRYADATKAFEVAESTYDVVMRNPSHQSLEESVALFRTALDQFTSIATIQSGFNDVDRYQEDIRRRIESLEKRQFSMKAARQQRLQRLREIAQEHMQQGDFSAARSKFEEILSLAPGDADARKGIEDSERRLAQRAQQARTRTSAKNFLERMRANLAAGIGFYEQAKFASAMKSWNQVDGDFNKLSEIPGISQTSDFSDGREIMSKTTAYRLAVQPKLDELHERARSIYGRGVTLESIGEVDKAIVEWRKIFEFITDTEDEYFLKATDKLKKYE